MRWHLTSPLGETTSQRKARLAREHREDLARLQRKQVIADGVLPELGNGPADEQDGPLKRLRPLLEVIDRLARGARYTG